MTAARGLLLAICVCPSVTGCLFGSDSVTRIHAGREIEGPYIPPLAYAHYAQGVIDEGHGDLERAEREYRLALIEDDSSPELWTRLGAVLCRQRKDPAAAFAEAAKLDPELAPLWREQARCALERGEAGRALAAGRRAVALDPSDEASSLIVIEALAKLGQGDESERWKRALLLLHPSSRAAQRVAPKVAPTTEPGPHTDPLGARRPVEARPTRADVDRALRAASADEVRALGVRAGVSSSELALRAAALGRTDLGQTLAERVLAADPDDSDAFIALLVCSSLDASKGELGSILARVGAEPLHPSPLGVRLFAELLRRRVSREAAGHWLQGWALSSPSDPLEQAVERRAAQ